MKMKIIPIVLIGLVLVLKVTSAQAAKTGQLETDEDRINYSVGYQIGGDFQKQGIGINPEALVQGIKDALGNHTPLMSSEEMAKTLVNLKKQIIAEERLRQDKQTRNFLAENLNNKGVIELPSGVQYRVIEPGSGPKPTLNDSVKIQFRTTMADGREVSNTFKTNEPKVYSMAKVMPGLQSVLPLMQEGATFEVVIPPGHTAKRSSDYLDKRGVLIYEIKLLSVIPATRNNS